MAAAARAAPTRRSPRTLRHAPAQGRGTKPDDSILRGRFDEKVQADMCREIALELGFDSARGRLGEAGRLVEDRGGTSVSYAFAPFYMACRCVCPSLYGRRTSLGRSDDHQVRPMDEAACWICLSAHRRQACLLLNSRYKADDFTEGLTGTIHETGHAIYEQGRNLAYDCLPVNEALSMGEEPKEGG